MIFIGKFIQPYTSIAVTGSHGKTSTTGLLSHVLSGVRPTSFLIGDGTGHGDLTQSSSHLKPVNIVVTFSVFSRLCDHDEYRF